MEALFVRAISESRHIPYTNKSCSILARHPFCGNVYISAFDSDKAICYLLASQIGRLISQSRTLLRWALGNFVKKQFCTLVRKHERGELSRTRAPHKHSAERVALRTVEQGQGQGSFVNDWTIRHQGDEDEVEKSPLTNPGKASRRFASCKLAAYLGSRAGAYIRFNMHLRGHSQSKSERRGLGNRYKLGYAGGRVVGNAGLRNF